MKRHSTYQKTREGMKEFKSLGKVAVEFLSELSGNILVSQRMPEDRGNFLF